MPSLRPFRFVLLALAGVLLAGGLLLATPACQTLRQVANLRNVNFAIEAVEEAELAGVDLSSIQGRSDVGVGELGRVGAALAQGRMPLAFTLVLGAQNPAENEVAARLVEMDWTLLLEDRETISGTFNQEVLLPAGETKSVPIEMRLDLLQFFDRGGQDLLDLALAVAGLGGEPKNIKLRARPSIDTPVGPVRYPRPITIDVGELGSGKGGL